MKENKTKTYCTPFVEVLNARVEKGFAGSGETPVPPTPPVNPEEGGFNAGDGTGWTDGGNTDEWFT